MGGWGGGGGVLDLFHCGGPRSEMNGLSSWSFAGIGRRVERRGGGHGQGQLRGAGVYRETPVWVPASPSRGLSPAVRELN